MTEELRDWRGTSFLMGGHVVYAVSMGGGSVSVKEGKITEIGPQHGESHFPRFLVVSPVRKSSWETDRTRKLTSVRNVTVVPE